jgi:hypothetical protein
MKVLSHNIYTDAILWEGKSSQRYKMIIFYEKFYFMIHDFKMVVTL